MPLYMIERAFAEELSVNSEVVDAVAKINADEGLTWLFSFLSTDKKKTYCLYEAPNPDAIRAAADKLGLPADTIIELGSELHPLGDVERAIDPDVFA